MSHTKDDLLEIIGQDLDYARAKLKIFARVFPETIKHALDVCDDKLASWSSKSIERNKKPGKGPPSKKD
jgi:hypothetical protein